MKMIITLTGIVLLKQFVCLQLFSLQSFIISLSHDTDVIKVCVAFFNLLPSEVVTHTQGSSLQLQLLN